MYLSEILSRLQIKGGSTTGGTSSYANFLPILNSQGILDSSFLPNLQNITLTASNISVLAIEDLLGADLQTFLKSLYDNVLRIQNNLNDVAIPLNSFNSIRQAAKTSYTGCVEVADSASVTSGTDTGTETLNGVQATKVVPPSLLKSNYLALTGGTLTGSLILKGTYSLTNEAIDKNYVDSSITTATSSVSGIITTTNITYVSTTGNDSTGLINRLDKPFLTLNAAKTATSSGGIIYVFPGTYTEANLLKTGVNWYFSPGAKVTYSSSGNLSLFDDSSNGANGAVTCNIYGYGEFTNNGTGTNNSILSVTNASSAIYFECLSSSTNSANAYNINLSNGTNFIFVRNNVISNNSAESGAISISGGIHKIRCNNITSYSRSIVISGGDAELICQDMSSSHSGVIDGSGGTARIYARDMTSSTANISTVKIYSSVNLELNARSINNNIYYPVLMDTTGIGKIINTKIISTWVHSTGFSVFVNNSSAALILKECDLTVDTGTTYSISGVASSKVTLHGYTRSNKTYDSSNITLSLGMFEVT